MSNNSRKNSSAYRGIPPLECPEDFNFQSSTDRTNKMYESCNSSDESREYDQDSMETEDFFQQNQPSINMKYISKTTIKYVNVLLIKQPENERELIPNLRVEVVKNKGVALYSLLDVLKKLGFPLYHTMIFFLEMSTNAFVYAGNDPIKQEIYLPLNPRRNNEISIKYRKPQHLDDADKSSMEEKKTMERGGLDRRERERERERDLEMRNRETLGNKKRIKERYIREVIDKVNLWRNYHKEGFYDRNQNRVISLSLEAAAQKVGISKKTLDDYLFQIRAGEKYGFNFEENYDQKIGILRSFVRKNRMEDKEIKTRPEKKNFCEEKTPFEEKTPNEPKNISMMPKDNHSTDIECNMVATETPQNFFNSETNNEHFITNEQEEDFLNHNIIDPNEQFDDFNMDMEENYDRFLNYDRDN